MPIIFSMFVDLTFTFFVILIQRFTFFVKKIRYFPEKASPTQVESLIWILIITPARRHKNIVSGNKSDPEIKFMMPVIELELPASW